MFETHPTNMRNFRLQNGMKTWVRLGASHLSSRDIGMSSQEDSEITNSRLGSTDTALPACYKQHKNQRNKKAELGMVCARFGSTYTEIGTVHRSPKRPQDKHEIRPAGTVAHNKLSFRHFKDQRNKYFEDATLRPGPPIWELSVFRMERNFALGSAHHTCNPVPVECRARRTVRSQIRDWPRQS